MDGKMMVAAKGMELQAYADVASRCRWFILATVLISGLILSHLFLEAWSFHQEQLGGVTGHRLLNGSKESLLEERDKFEGLSLEERAEQREEIEKFSRSWFRTKMTDNELETASFGHREIPLLGLLLPANDFVPVMSIFLVIFSAGSWLNLRTMLAVTMAMEGDREFARLAKLYFTFTGLQDSDSHRLANAVQILAFWSPPMVLGLALILDFVFPLLDQLNNPDLYSGPSTAMVVRGAILVVCLLSLVSLSQLSILVANKVDRRIHEPVA